MAQYQITVDQSSVYYYTIYLYYLSTFRTVF